MKKIKLISIMLIFSLVLSIFSPCAFAVEDENIKKPTGGIQLPVMYEMTEEEAELAKSLVDTHENVLSAPELFAFSNNHYGSTYGYSKLKSTAEKNVYLELLSGATAFQESNEDAVLNAENNVYNAINKNLSKYGLDKDEFSRVYFTFLYDNPQIYWVESVGYFFNPQTNILTNVVLNCHPEYISGSDRVIINQTIDTTIERYLDYVAPLKTDYEKAFWMHELIIGSVDYAYDSNGNPELSSWAHNIIGIFYNNNLGIVCEGYAKAFQLLMNASGIECILVVGDAGGGHAWNQIKLDNEWYNVDVTWDDVGIGSDGISRIRWDYFNVTDAQFTDHSPYPSIQESRDDNTWCYDVNVCTATTNSYANKGKVNYDDVVTINYTSDDEIGFFVFNNGVHVASNTTVKPGTKLDIEIYAYTDKLVEDYYLMLNGTTKLNFSKDAEKTESSIEGVTAYTLSCIALESNMNFELVPKQLRPNNTEIKFTSKGVNRQISVYYGDSTISSAKLTFSTDNPYVATVSSTGVVKSIGPGKATITIKYPDKNMQTTVSVIGNQSYTLGDVNNDSAVDISDAYCMLKFLTYRIDTPTPDVLPAANFLNTDSVIDVSDVYTFIKYLSNNI